MVLTLEKYNDEAVAGHLSKRMSDNNRFCIFNYTLKTQLNKIWNNITLNARGTIFDVYTERLIARGLPKFFNVSEIKENEFGNLVKLSATHGFQVSDKLDGSCGIVYFDRYQDKLCVATRGSFISEQAIWATNYLHTKMSCHSRNGLRELIGSNYKNTPIFEIVYPDNKIIVDYKGRECLILIQVIDNDTGLTLPYTDIISIANDIDVEHIEYCDDIYDLSQLKYLKENLDNGMSKEGWVVRFGDGHLVKFKLDDYLRIAKALYHFGPKVVFGLAKRNQDLVQFFMENEIPDELFEASLRFYSDVISKFDDILQGLCRDFEWVFSTVGSNKDRKDYAVFMKKEGMDWYIGCFFDWKSGKDISSFVWEKMMDYRDFEWKL